MPAIVLRHFETGPIVLMVMVRSLARSLPSDWACCFRPQQSPAFREAHVHSPFQNAGFAAFCLSFLRSAVMLLACAHTWLGTMDALKLSVSA
jgi:hypothetical protein